jgi:hypothetical protein
MVNDPPMPGAWRDMQSRLDADAAMQDEPQTLKGGGGGGTSDGMEPRVAKLESDMDHVKKGVDRIDAGISELRKALSEFRVEAAKAAGETKAGFATLDERTKTFPTRWETFIVFSVLIGVLATLVKFLT